MIICQGFISLVFPHTNNNNSISRNQDPLFIDFKDLVMHSKWIEITGIIIALHSYVTFHFIFLSFLIAKDIVSQFIKQQIFRTNFIFQYNL